MICKACNIGILEDKEKVYKRMYLEVYELVIIAYFKSCNFCGASIITKEDRKRFKEQIKLKIDQLYYN